MGEEMDLMKAMERLGEEKVYAELALMDNPNDERYRSLVDAVNTVTETVDKICCVIVGTSFRRLVSSGGYSKIGECLENDGEEDLPFE